jgi:uncharacterized protein YbaP (TraB family)
MHLRFPHLTYPLRPPGRRGIAWRCVGAVVLAFSLLALPAAAEPALWVATSGAATVHFFGTVHALKPDTKWETPKIAAAFAQSQEVWLELEDADPKTLQPLMAELGVDQAHPLSTKVGAADLARLEAAAKFLGLPGEVALEPMRPWAAALTLATLPIVKAGYDPAKGVDQVLKAQAVAMGKPVHGLETAEQQMHFFADLPQATQVRLLRSVLDEAGEGPAALGAILKAWSKGDLVALDRELNALTEKNYRDLYAILIVQRNQAWAERIAAHLGSAPGVTFIAVGAAHLVGRDSLQKALERRGISVARE